MLNMMKTNVVHCVYIPWFRLLAHTNLHQYLENRDLALSAIPEIIKVKIYHLKLYKKCREREADKAEGIGSRN